MFVQSRAGLQTKKAAAPVNLQAPPLKKLLKNQAIYLLPARTAAAVAVTAASCAAAVTAAAVTIFTRFGFVDDHFATVDFLAVELGNRSLTFLFRRHFDKR